MANETDRGILPSDPLSNEEADTATSMGYSSSYKAEWERTFMVPGFSKILKQQAIDGHLRSSRFRSVCWKVYLEVLGGNVAEWAEKTREWRMRYDELKESLVVNPRETEVDPTLHNPLSQEDESPWNRFFQDNELRLTIKQDVIRTYPDIEFFKESGLRETMTDVLFCFAKTCRLGYRQGMHELLAPLIFVLHCDHQAFLHACELEELGDILKEVLDPKYIEHDAFALFCQIMVTAEHWYVSKEISPTLRPREVKTRPFARAQDFNPSNVIVNKLKRIQDYLLKKVDLELYQHLEQLEIPPQVYGIRWLRLLFGREFAMQDLLVVWDAIFADSVGFELVDYIFVAMLLYLREALLTSDYPTCLHFLMKYPPVGDINYFIQKALYLREPSQHTCPPAYTYQKPASLANSSYGDMFQPLNGLPTTFIHTGKRHQPLKNTANSSKMTEKASAMMTSGFASLTRRLGATNQNQGHQKPRGYSTLPRNLPKASSVPPKTAVSETSSPVSETNPASLNTASSRKESSASLSKLEDIPGFNPFRSNQSSQNSRTHSRTHSLEQGIPADVIMHDRSHSGKSSAQAFKAPPQSTEQKLANCMGSLNDMESMCFRCANKMDLHIDKIQGEMLRNSLDNEDELLLALAGLKQVRDVLKGVLKPASIFDTEEIHIRDDHYVQGSESPARIQMQARPDSSFDSSPEAQCTDTSDGANSPASRTNSIETPPTPNRSNSLETPPVTPSAILKQDIRDRTEVELRNFPRLEVSYNEADQSGSPKQKHQSVNKTNTSQK